MESIYGPVLNPFTNCLADWNYTRSLLLSTKFTTPGLFEIDSTPIMCVLFWVSTYLLVFQCCWLVLILSSLAASTICIIHMIWIFAFWYAQKLCLEAIKPHGNPRIVITLIYTIEWAAIYLPTCCSVARFKHSYYSRSHVRLWPRWIVSKALLQ